jgi:hypothetical protein
MFIAELQSLNNLRSVVSFCGSKMVFIFKSFHCNKTAAIKICLVKNCINLFRIRNCDLTDLCLLRNWVSWFVYNKSSVKC